MAPCRLRLFNAVNSLAFRAVPDLEHFRWRFTPFINYPKEGTTYWRWEREWRIRGDLHFEPEHIVVLFALEGSHETMREMWLWELLDADNGPCRRWSTSAGVPRAN